VARCGLDASGSEQEPMAGSCIRGNESLHCIKGGAFLDQLSDYFSRILHHGVI